MLSAADAASTPTCKSPQGRRNYQQRRDQAVAPRAQRSPCSAFRTTRTGAHVDATSLEVDRHRPRRGREHRRGPPGPLAQEVGERLRAWHSFAGSPTVRASPAPPSAPRSPVSIRRVAGALGRPLTIPTWSVASLFRSDARDSVGLRCNSPPCRWSAGCIGTGTPKHRCRRSVAQRIARMGVP